jgi:SAM-dependent methyltransferase
VAINRSLVSKLGASLDVTADYDATLTPTDRKRNGTWYTPHALVAHVVAQSIPLVRPGEVVRVLDPACGDGRFLFEAARVIRSAGAVPELTGVDIDLGGLVQTRTEAAEIINADALTYDWRDRHFDVVLGNPPFLSQMASATARTAPSAFGGGPYADAAADFLALALRLARPDGGRVGLVLPLSLLTARDAGPIRAAALQGAALDWFWASRELLFDAMVRTCAVGLQRGPVVALSAPVRRTAGISFEPLAPVAHSGFATANDHWGSLIADSFGMPSVPPLRTVGTLSEHALATANFRDQYYGLVGAVSDSGDGPPLITTGLIDVAECQWGKRQTRFAKRRFDAPRVDRGQLAPFMQRWADRCLVPKVLVATQTHVLEAVADEAGEWLPAVPVIRVVPDDHRDVWAMAALLTSPVASALIAEQSVGSGLSATTVRVSQRTLGALPWPAGSLSDAVHALRNGDIESCGRAVDAAFGITATDDDELFSWWHNGVKHQRGRH